MLWLVPLCEELDAKLNIHLVHVNLSPPMCSEQGLNLVLEMFGSEHSTKFLASQYESILVDVGRERNIVQSLVEGEFVVLHVVSLVLVVRDRDAVDNLDDGVEPGPSSLANGVKSNGGLEAGLEHVSLEDGLVDWDLDGLNWDREGLDCCGRMSQE